MRKPRTKPKYPRKLLFRASQLLPRADALRLREPLLDQFLFSRLDGELRLREGDGVLRRIAVRRDEVARVSCQGNVVDLALRAGTEIDHSADAREMVCWIMPRVATRSDRLLDDGLEIPSLRLTKRHLPVAGTPKLGAGLGMVLNRRLKTRMKLRYNLGIHQLAPCSGMMPPLRAVVQLVCFILARQTPFRARKHIPTPRLTR